MKKLPALALAALLLPACEKDTVGPDGLVKATQEGKNTGDFLLNGTAYGPGRSDARPGVPVSAYRSSVNKKKITLFFNRLYNQDETGLNIVLSDITHTGLVTISDGVSPAVISGNKSYILYSISQPSPARYFLTGPTALGRVEITRYDTVARIISGTFEAHLREYNGPDTLHITKGRFDCTF